MGCLLFGMIDMELKLSAVFQRNAGSKRQNLLSFNYSQFTGEGKQDFQAVCLNFQCGRALVLVQPFSCYKRDREQLWQHLFLDPSQWWDHRFGKANPRYPDFKHKKTKEALWIDGRSTPKWVKAELPALSLGSLQRSVYSWTARISSYVRAGQEEKALELFHKMQKEGLQPDTYTFVLVLKACSSLKALDEGRQVHARVIQCDSESNIFVGSSLIDMYARCGRMEDAFRVFKNMPTHDVVVWNSMIAGYVKTGQGYKALKFFQEMQKEKLEPDALTFVALLNACASMATLEEGRHLHLQVVQKGLEANLFIGSALVDMYVKCGIIEDAYRAFCNLPVHDVVSWSSMITGYVRYGQGEKALELFHQMQKEHVKPDSITFVSVLNACASTVALETGRHIHAQVLRKGLESDIFVGSSLIDMYAKCGSIEDACKVFNNMPFRNAVSWNAMILGFGMHGLGKNTCQMFEQMCQECAELNDATFVCLLAAFSFTGLVDNGCCCFESMTPIYGISMKAEHYSCMVDLLGRSGCLDEAASLIRTMWCPPHACVWRALLCSCRIHGNVKMGELAAKHLLELDPENASGYVLMSNIYAVAGNWESAHNVQQLRSKRHVYKQQGCSCLR